MIKSCTLGVGNTRAERTYKTYLRGLIDWLSVTFEVKGADWSQVTQLLGLEGLDFAHQDWSMDGYNEEIRYDKIVIRHKIDTDYYQLYLTGQGCRQYESYSRIDWLDLFLILDGFCNAKATRIDLAIDDFKGYYNVDLIRRTFLDGRCVTRLKKARDLKEYDTGTLAMTMDSFYLGSIKSRLSINFYDKKLERVSQKKEVTVDTWTRTELRCKKEYADEVMQMLLLHDGDFGKVALGILKTKIRFVKKTNDSNRRRIDNIQWWDRFVADVSELQLSLVAPDKTVEKSKKWIEHSVAPTLAMLRAADPYTFNAFLDDLLDSGQSRLSDRHYDMIKTYHNDKIQKVKKDIARANIDLSSDNSILYDKIKKDVQN